MCLAKTAYVYAACAVHVTILVLVIIRPVSHFTELHTLTLAARSYALLVELIFMISGYPIWEVHYHI